MVRFQSRDADRLRIYVNAWRNAFKSVQHYEKGSAVRDRSGRQKERTVRDWDLKLPAEERQLLSQQMAKEMRGYFSIDDTGNRLITWLDDSGPPFDLAVALFLRIASHREGWRITSCANVKCGRYFLKKTRPSVITKFCPKCRRKESGPRMKKLRDAKRNEILAITRKACAKLPLDCKDPKNWIVDNVNHILRRRNLEPIKQSSVTRWERTKIITIPVRASCQN